MAKRRRFKFIPKLDINKERAEVFSDRNHEDLVLQFLDRNAVQQKPDQPAQHQLPIQQPVEPPRQSKRKQRAADDLKKVYYTWPKQGTVGPNDVRFHVSTNRPDWLGRPGAGRQ